MVLQVERVAKSFGPVVANDDVSLELAQGEVCGLLGPNGAGKTTLVRQVVGLTRPDDGRILVDGLDVTRQPGEVRRRCALQPQGALAITGLTARQAIELAGALRGMSRRAAATIGGELLEELDLLDHADRRMAATSGGVNRLVMFCMAVVSAPRLIILDEPTNDVDPMRRRTLWAIVRRVASQHGAAVLLVTHNVLEAERSVDRVAIIDRGRVAAEGSPASLRPADAPLKLEFVARPGTVTDGVAARLRDQQGDRHVVDIAADEVPAVVDWARRHTLAGTISDFSLTPQTLEDTYLEIIQAGRATDVAA